MKKERIIPIIFSLLAVGTISLTPLNIAQDGPGADAPENGDVIEKKAPPESDDNAPQKRRKEIRIERRGPDGKMRLRDGKENADIIIHDRPIPKKRIEPFAGGEARIFRKAPGGNGDIVIRRFGQPGIPVEPNEGRRQHLEQAIEHLHAAGLHDIAERLETRLQREIPQPREPRELAGLREEIEKIKRQHQKLQDELRKLNETLGALNREGSKTRE